MNLRNPFRRNARSIETDKSEAVYDVMRPWWAWGPLGLVWYGTHHSSHPGDPGQMHDPGQFHHPGDAGNFHNPGDMGGGFGGFDGGGGAI